MKLHNLKTLPDYYYRVFSGQKTFEVRKNDRDFQINDHLKLMEWDGDKNEYTGREMFVRVDYILHGGMFGIEEGYVVMAIKPVS